MPNKSKIDKFHDEQEFKRIVIEEYLPKILKNEITIEQIERQGTTTGRTIDKIIKKYYEETENEEGMKQYTEAKLKNRGASVETRKRVKEAREELKKIKLVTPKEFEDLSEKEQYEQLKSKVKIEILKNPKAGIMNDESVQNKISLIMQYFKGKNDPQIGKVNFSEKEIRQIIYTYPAIVKRSPETLEDKMEIYISKFGKEAAYKMVKKYPGIMGFSQERIKKQLNLLEKNGLLDYVVETPKLLINSVEKLETLINWTKVKNPGVDLNTLSINEIFINHNEMKSEINHKTKGSEMLKELEESISKTNSINGYTLGLVATSGETIDIEEIDKSFKELTGAKEKTRGENK